MKKYSIILILFSFTILSCGTMDKSDRISRRYDFFNRFSKTELKAINNWKVGDDILILRKNKTFRYYSKVMGLLNSGYYSGNFEKINDSTIVFDFYKNNKHPFFINDTLRISKQDDFEILKNSEGKYLAIMENKLQ